MKISVIIPVYKVSSFAGKCAESLMRQSFSDVEFIFVDDASPDNSIEIIKNVIKNYPDRDVKIVTHAHNQGLPSARNTGMEQATGDYIFHCDGDDFVEPNLLQSLYDAAEKDNADVVWCDFYLTFSKKERYMKVGDFTNPEEALKAMLAGSMKYNVWNKLIKRNIYTDNDIKFPDGNGMGEDMTIMMAFACAKTSAYVPKALYHYVKTNNNAFSQTMSQAHLDSIRHNTDRILKFMDEKYGDRFDREKAFFKLSVKFPFLITDDNNMHQIWKEWYSEANDFIDQIPGISSRSRWLQQMAAKGNFYLIKLYYRIVYKFIYGLVYR